KHIAAASMLRFAWRDRVRCAFMRTSQAWMAVRSALRAVRGVRDIARRRVYQYQVTLCQDIFSGVNRASLAGDGKSRENACLGLGALRSPDGSTVRARTDAELRAECAVEIRDIAEPAPQCDVENPGGLHHQPHRGPAKARPHDVLMRRHARQVFERAQEVEGA